MIARSCMQLENRRYERVHIALMLCTALLVAGYAVRLAYTDAVRQQIASHEALALAQQHPDLISADQTGRLQGSDAAQMVDRPIADSDAQIKRVTRQDAGTVAARQRARSDRRVAWRQRFRRREVAEDYEALCEEHALFPGCKLTSLGHPLMYLPRADQARYLFDSGRFTAATRFADKQLIANPKRQVTEQAVRWRVHAGVSDGHERYTDGDVTLRRAMLGIEYRIPDLSLQFDATGNSYGVVGGGAELRATWNPNDQWLIAGKGARFSPSTPLRALAHGITADSADLKSVYRRSESSLISIGAGTMGFSDGNNASKIKADLVHRVHTTPSLTVDALFDVEAKRNARPQEAYYSPARELQGLVGIDVGQVFARRHERYAKNIVTLQGGSYFEQGYGSRWEKKIGDKLAYHATNALEVDLGMTFGRMVYEGVSQRELTVAFGVSWRI